MLASRPNETQKTLFFLLKHDGFLLSDTPKDGNGILLQTDQTNKCYTRRDYRPLSVCFIQITWLQRQTTSTWQITEATKFTHEIQLLFLMLLAPNKYFGLLCFGLELHLIHLEWSADVHRLIKGSNKGMR